MTTKIVKVVLNYTKKNYHGDICDWGNKPGRLMSVTYCLDNGGYIIKDTSWPLQHSFRHVGITSNVDWSTRETAPTATRFISKY